jgi:hypothetical protein
MTERERLIQEIRAGLSKLEKGAAPFDPMGVVNDLGPYYSIPPEEIRAIVIQEADAAGINHN